MDNAWSITQVNLTHLNLRYRGGFREFFGVLVAGIFIGTGICAWNALGTGIDPRSAHPRIVGAVVFIIAGLIIAGMIGSAQEHLGLETASEISGRLDLQRIIADQPDPVSPALGVSLGEVLRTSNAILSGPSSEQATPPEERPDRRIIAALFRLILWIVVAVVALVALASAIYMANSSLPAPKHPIQLFKMIVAGPAAIIACLLGLLARTRKKSADHLLEYDRRPPIVFLRSFADDDCKVWMARSEEEPVRVGFEDALSEIFFHIGPFIALGSRKELIPRLGAARTYRDDSVWQAKAERWMDEAGCILYMPGSGDGLEWEIGRITQGGLLDKTLCLFRPEPGWRGLAQKRRLQNWNHFLQAFANTELHDALKELDGSDVVLIWIGTDRRIFVVRAKGKFFQEYELAVRIALVRNAAAYAGKPLDVGATASRNLSGPVRFA